MDFFRLVSSLILLSGQLQHTLGKLSAAIEVCLFSREGGAIFAADASRNMLRLEIGASNIVVFPAMQAPKRALALNTQGLFV